MILDMISSRRRLFNVGRPSRAGLNPAAKLTLRLIPAALICAQLILLPVPAQGLRGSLTHARPFAPSADNSTRASAATVAQANRNASTLTVFVGVRDGRLIVDRAKSAGGFAASDEFRRRLRAGTSAAEIEKTLSGFRDILFDDLDKEFRSLDKVYRYALNDTEKAKEPDDALTKEVRSFSGRAGVGDWAEFTALFDRWAASGVDRYLIRQVFTSGGILQSLRTVGRQTALTINPDARPPNRTVDVVRGSLKFKVADPIGDMSDENEYRISFPNEPDAGKAAEKRKTILKLLKSLEGKLWRGSRIKSLIEEYYAERGLVGVVKISPAGQPHEIVIPEGARIARLVFHKDVPEAEIDKLAYLLLPDKQFRTFARTHPLEPLTAKDDAGRDVVLYRAVDFRKLATLQGTEPFLNQYGFQIQQLELSQLGFIAAPLQTPEEVRSQSANGSSYVDIYVFKADEEEKGEKPDDVPEKAIAVADEAGVARARRGGASGSVTDFVPPLTNASTAQTVSTEGAPDGDAPATEDAQPSPASSPLPSPTPSPTPRSAQTWQPKDRKNYVGGGLRYRPGQGIRLFGFAQRERLGLLSSQDIISLQGGAHDSALGALSYSSDFTLFKALGHRRVSLQLTGKSDFNARRTFNGVETDERRTGGLLRGELELFRDRADSMLRFYFEGQRATVELLQDDRTFAKQNLTTLDFGGIYLFEDRIARRPKRLLLEPRLRVGLGLSDGEPQFTSFLLSGNYHQQMSRAMEVDFNARVELAGRRTPLYELPSFGGAEVVRGFREDDAIGRRLWSLQSELWTPLPGTGGAEEGFRKFLRRQVRLAGFLDVGGAYETTASKPGVRFGPGLGARIIYRPAIIKLDWAYGIGDAATTGRGRGRFYFSVGTNLPF